MPLGPVAGLQYPRSLGEFQAWFSTDADCLDYLEWLRWPAGFVCSSCAHIGGWRLADGRLRCAACGRRTSATAGTIFDRTRTPLTVWFTACWLFATQKDGVSALSIQRALDIGSYQTAWAMLHRLRSVLVRPGRERLQGTVEVDETYIGGDEPGLSGGRAKGKKVLVGIAVERAGTRGFGRCRMAVLADASSDSLRALLVDHIEEGATVVTDGWQPYRPATRDLYVHDRLRAGGSQASKLLPGPHRVASLAKRWASWDPPRARERQPPGQLPQRVRVPVQSSAITQPRDALLPGTRARRSPRTGALRGLDHPEFDGDRVIWLSISRNEIERGREIYRTGDRIVTRSLKLRGRDVAEA
jgi:hypothetical protein